ncbi:MAG: HpsJ family protein [Xenococcaceae cyanobacterium]
MLTSQFTSLCLKLASVVLIISSILDYITLIFPFKFPDRAWQITVAGQLVDRGVVPLVGIVFLVLAYWIDNNTERVNPAKKSSFDLRFPAFILASSLGLIFLLIVPLHLSNLIQINSAKLTQIQQGADQAESQIKAQFEKLSQLANDPQSLQKLDAQIQDRTTAIGSGQLQGKPLNPSEIQQLEAEKKQLQSVRELSKNPKALKERLNEIQTQLRGEKLEQENNEKSKVIREGIRTLLSSLLLAIGYIAMGWIGLKNLGKTSKPHS